MRILWITNIMLPPLCEKISLSTPVGGGWLYSSLRQVFNLSNHTFAVATIYSGSEFISHEIDGIKYYLLPLKGKLSTEYNAHLEEYWRLVRHDFAPNIIHIHGTEYPHGLAYIRANGNENVVVSIQGIISEIAKHYKANIPSFWSNSLFITRERKGFIKRGVNEIELLRNVKHVIGRTQWDESHVWAINQNATYHFCGETLRQEFYKHKWSYSNCKPHTIFASQGGYTIKGLHMILQALPLIKKAYPDVKLYVAGGNVSRYPWYRVGSYPHYIKYLINKYELNSNIEFTGTLDEKAMCRQYLDANVFVCPSSIENSPNSLGEAQLLGMPCLASYAGGIPSIMKGREDCLYRFEEVAMLAKQICTIFGLKEHVNTEYDCSRYDSVNNAKNLLEIYNTVSE